MHIIAVNSCSMWHCLCVILLLCVLLFSRFFCFWALGVTLFSPYGSCSPTLNPKSQWRDSQLEAQLSNMEFSAVWVISVMSGQNTNDILAGLIISIKYTSMCNFHSSNDQISKKVNCGHDSQCIPWQRYDSYIQGLSLLWVWFETCYMSKASAQLHMFP
jgi:hypothetical protein